jgi:oligopeptide transport system ATP-binding protein
LADEPLLGVSLVSETVLHVEDLRKAYGARRRRLIAQSDRPDRHGERPALGGVSVALGRGEVLGIVGESGSGKSTLAWCISMLERPNSGRVVLNGVELTALSARQLRHNRRRVQVVFQNPYASLNPRLSVGSMLAEVLRVHQLVDRDRINARVVDLLALVGIPSSAAGRFPSEFSGGQRQRLCIARAIAAEPDLLIADEALSSLDVSIQAQVLNLLLALREELQLSMLFISHDLHVVRRIASAVAVMFGGRIVELLPRDVPLEEGRHPYTLDLLAALPSLSGGPPAAARGSSDLGAALPAQGCPFRDRCKYVLDACTHVDPPLSLIGGRHLVACHYVANTHAASVKA